MGAFGGSESEGSRDALVSQDGGRELVQEVLTDVSGGYALNDLERDLSWRPDVVLAVVHTARKLAG